jgi:serine/threonine-protein kinase CHEK2
VNAKGCFETDDGNLAFIMMELMDGSLAEMFSNTYFNEDTLQLLTYEMLLALEYLHSKNIIHRDIKPENILTASCSIASVKFKLADFGLAKILGLSRTAHTLCGTPLYNAPEVNETRAGYTTKVDIWSLGATVYFW